VSKNVQSVRGMNDLLPEANAKFLALESVLRTIASVYGYKEVRLPIIEFTELFQRTIGEATDIVEKEMYTFLDRDKDSLTLRPEGTAGCVRLGIEHGLLYNQIQRFFYTGPMFRHERPQKGRYRQFYQFGVEAFGMSGPDIDIEILLLGEDFWQALGIEKSVELNINSLGSAATRAAYRQKLVDYFNNNFACLDEDSKRRLQTNPLRILDSKNPALANLILDAPKIIDCFDKESALHFDKVCAMLDLCSVKYKVNPCLVRGLDYYCHTVFEWVTNELGAQGAICAGGHYDGLVEQLGGKSTPAIGFAIGLERLAELLKYTLPINNADVYIVVLGDAAELRGMLLARRLRNEFLMPVILNCGGGSLSSQMKRADKSGAKIAFIIGENELKARKICIKYLRENRPQQEISEDKINDFIEHELLGECSCNCQTKNKNNC